MSALLVGGHGKGFGADSRKGETGQGQERSDALGLIGYKYPKQNQGAADISHGRHGLAEKQCACYHRSDRIEIDIIGRFHRSDARDGPIPQHEANKRGNESEKQEIHPYHWPQETGKRKLPRQNEKDGQDSEEAVEKDLACDKNRTVTARRALHQQAVYGPAECSTECERVA